MAHLALNLEGVRSDSGFNCFQAQMENIENRMQCIYYLNTFLMCSYAGLACQEIRGHSKSVGYEPGMKIREDTFQNTWNVVLVLGDWWPVQCNWGAR